MSSLILRSDPGSRIDTLKRGKGANEGKNPHDFIADEVHTYKKRDLHDELIQGMGGRLQPITFYITTDGEYYPNSICAEVDRYAQKILMKQINDEQFFTTIYTCDKNEEKFLKKREFKEEELSNFHKIVRIAALKANPSVGVIFDGEDVAKELDNGRKMSVMRFNDTMQKRLNIHCIGGDGWLSANVIEKACVGFPDELIRKSRKVCIGLDIGQTVDSTVFAYLYPAQHKK